MVTANETTFHAVRRSLAESLRHAAPGGMPRALETSERGAREAPAVRPAEIIEGATLECRAVPGAPEARFDAFLDGSQLTLVAWWEGPVPVVHGTASAAIRVRRERRLTTWGEPIVRRALYVPRPLLSKDMSRAVDAAGVNVIDTMARRDPESVHPFALQDLAYQRVLAERESVEQDLAAQWVARERGLLFVDGGVSSNVDVATSPNVVGVVKTHQTLHVESEGLAVLVALARGERTSVVRIDSKSRPSVASWYLRTATPQGGDPFWGLVRVEVALPAKAKPAAITRRADEVSRWILAERLPLALPDTRWDRMAYGIRDAEEFLRAVQ